MKLAVLQHISTRSNELFGLPPRNDLEHKHSVYSISCPFSGALFYV